ncbi:hypothetical protein SCB49_13820 [unidentified eubacterium SCB49]|nr:hypothetical protein SCB49_13820 [unidentified eubacterium SCB49]
MNILQYTILLLCTTTLLAQEETEIYVIDIQSVEDTIVIKNVRNISNNIGYDSQPSFSSNEFLLYAGTENDQTEIMSFNLTTNTKTRINATTAGGEYSPQKFPNSNKIAAVRLDPDGLQRLYRYDLNKNGLAKSTALLEEYKIAYFAFHDDNNIVASVLNNNDLELIKANLTSGEVDKITTNAGRSIHKIPSSNSISYTAVNEDGVHEIFVINILEDSESFYVCDLPIGIQDHCWYSVSELLLGSGSKLYKYDFFGNAKWEEIADLTGYNISEINRITVSPDKSKIALVATPLTSTKD